MFHYIICFVVRLQFKVGGINVFSLVPLIKFLMGCHYGDKPLDLSSVTSALKKGLLSLTTFLIFYHTYDGL